MEILDVAVIAATKCKNVGWFEASVTIIEGESMKKISVDFPVSDLKEMGVCKNLNGWGRVRAWANSEEGHKYIVEKRNRKSMFERLNA